MLTRLPEIVVDESAAPAPKRRRLNTPHAESVTLESVCNASDSVSSAQITSIPSTCAIVEEISDNTLVCYGMVRRVHLSFVAYTYVTQISDLKVQSSSHHVASPISAQHPIRFEPPRTLYRGSASTPIGRLDEYWGELLKRLVADDELILQLVLFSAPIAPSIKQKTPRSDLQYLGVTIYGPRCRCDDVGIFMTRVNCFLDDPVGCDFNVPYMNPQCLFSLHERPPMTFDLPQLQQPYIDSFSRASLDILSGFETADDFESSASPTALLTELKEYVICRERGVSTNLVPKASETSPYFLPATRTRYAPKQRWCWHMAAEYKCRPVYVRMPEAPFQYPTLNMMCFRFVNAVTGEVQSAPGPVWRGGLLADEMGLGKTLSMIALIASDQDRRSNDDRFTCSAIPETYIPSTLIVVPVNCKSACIVRLHKY